MKYLLSLFLFCSALLNGGELHDAVRFNNTEEVKKLLDQGVDPNQRDERKNHPLFLCKQKVIFDLLVKHGANTKVYNTGGSNLLNWSCFYGRIDIVKALIAMGHKVNHLDKRGKSPLMSAAEGFRNGLRKEGHENIDIGELLLEHGADVNLKGKSGCALHRAVQKGKVSFVEFLIKNGAKTDVKDAFKKLPVDYISWIKNEETKNKISQLLNL